VLGLSFSLSILAVIALSSPRAERDSARCEVLGERHGATLNSLSLAHTIVFVMRWISCLVVSGL